MHVCCCDRLNLRVRDVLHNDWDTELPEEHLLIITCRSKLGVIVQEGDCVYWTQMVTVCDNCFTAPDVPLCHLFVHISHQEGILSGLVWVDLPTERTSR